MGHLADLSKAFCADMKDLLRLPGLQLRTSGLEGLRCPKLDGLWQRLHAQLPVLDKFGYSILIWTRLARVSFRVKLLNGVERVVGPLAL